MTGLELISLDRLLKALGEDDIKNILSSFSCPLNTDVEKFLHSKAIEFNKQGISKTFLIVKQHKEKIVIAGYFTISTKVISIKKKRISRVLQKRIGKFAQYNHDLKLYILSCPLLGQLGLNYAYENRKLISGDKLMDIALEKVKELHRIGGGKTVYLECEDKTKLVEFYEKHGFVEFDRRKLDREEINDFQGNELLQMIAYLG